MYYLKSIFKYLNYIKYTAITIVRKFKKIQLIINI